MRLIDADALFRRISREMDCGKLYLPVDFQEMIATEPTAEAEPVVRCKQCKQWDDSSEGRYVGGWCFCDRLQMSTSPDWFCAKGEAKHEQTD